MRMPNSLHRKRLKRLGNVLRCFSLKRSRNFCQNMLTSVANKKIVRMKNARSLGISDAQRDFLGTP